ncbi:MULTISPECIES: hypothetical protein [Klebsiella/Raoultella group]|uniref:hypothetical protein n=1 Tax=Klebsiella/Raoultella group TaxID=2890311 RepID=UPI001CCA26BF|nr:MULTISPECIES: hypothetical protein [Klebsiella]MCW9474457.1 hypothetical protein [Klebsiella grimontii]MCW9529180.1 hypothetical protein [Klebsiella grimontii]MCW9644351.1 hypothetical protein [Klebsiella michiganensis]MDX6056374.1 hypothetical protein [Klebsiella sp. JN_Kp126]WFX46979.1 hypothetical protein NFK05_24850 [Klebsiella michiganensis]
MHASPATMWPYFLFWYQDHIHTRPACSFRQLLIASNQERKMYCPNFGTPEIRLHHVGKKDRRGDWRNYRGLAGPEGAPAGVLIGSAIPMVCTLAGGLIGFLSGACTGVVAGSVAGEKLDGTIFDEYGCTYCEHT